ncbi:MAG: hypothetical protein QOF84_7861 [Streptomyces sp.]|nr:hypothetical protein [Streptomyces sp.]
MKLHRSLAAAAATAAIVPAALIGASAVAHADETAPATTAAVASESASTDATASESADAGASDSASASASASASGSASASASASDTASPSASASVSASDSASASASASPTTGLNCDDSGDDYIEDPNLTTALTGLPSKVTAGSGWHGFTLDVSNSSDAAYDRVDLGVFTGSVDTSTYQDTTGYLTLQWQDPESGTWNDISLDENDEGAGYVGFTDVKPNESFSLNLRLSVAKSAPAGIGFAISAGIYANNQGECVYSGGDSYYEFAILAAGSDAGDPGDAEPQTGGTSHVKPAGDTQIGSLADTGSSSALPVIALAGGAAVALGGGAMFVVRRRKAGARA